MMETADTKPHTIALEPRYGEEFRAENLEVSPFALVNVLVRRIRTIIGWALIVAIVAVLPAMLRGTTYSATASFMPQDNGTSSVQSLAAIVGQRAAPVSTQSPDFYVLLLRSNGLLTQIVRDTFAVSEEGGRRASFIDLLGIGGASARAREDNAVTQLRAMTSVGSDKPTGVVTVSVESPWPSLSLALANALIAGVNDFNQRTRQSQASAERKYVEEQLATANQDLSSAENELETFSSGNRSYENSPQLVLRQDRIRRRVLQKQTVVNSLTLSFEDAKAREVRDTPVLTIVDSPSLPITPEPRGRLKRAILGAFVGGALAALFIVVGEISRRAQSTADPEARQFFALAADVRRRWFGWLPGRRGRQRG